MNGAANNQKQKGVSVSKQSILNEFVTNEYTALKTELISCREKFSSSNIGILSLIIAILTFGITFYDLTKDMNLQGDKYAHRINIMIVVIQIAIFIVPLIILYVISAKMEKNYRHMLMISIYLQVFYEYAPRKKDVVPCSWEHTRQILFEPNHKEKFFQKMLSFFNRNTANMEYYVVTTFVSIFQAVFILMRTYNLWHQSTDISFVYFALILFVPMLILWGVQTAIWHNTSIQKLNAKYSDYYTKLIIAEAHQRGVLERNQRADCYYYVMKSHPM